MNILFVHTNFPAQFGAVGAWLAKNGWEVTFATQRPDVKTNSMRIVRFKNHRACSTKTHHYLQGSERAVITGQGFARAAVDLRLKGYQPDLVVGHSGWGAGMFSKDVWPRSRFVQYAEWYYSFPAIDRTRHEPEKDELEERARSRVRNAPFWLDFSAADATISPTRFQAERFPVKIRPQITILPDGINSVTHRPGPRDNSFVSSFGIPASAELVTYIARGMEPARGFPEFMAAIGCLQRQRSNVHAVIIGEDRVAYGQKSVVPSWKMKLLKEMDLDKSRLHFVRLVNRPTMIKFLQAADVHVYLSASFVLSWSFLEAMSCGVPVVAANSEPVREFVEDGRHGCLVDAGSPEDVSSAIVRILDNPEYGRTLGGKARNKIVMEFDAATIVYPAHHRFFCDLLTT